jgi:hypothetical protein
MSDIENKFPDTLEDVPVRLFKLISGESIIAYVHDNGNLDNIAIEEPMRVSVEDEHQLVFTPYLPFSESTLHHIDMDNIMIETDVTLDIKAYYMKILLDQVEGIEQENTEISQTIRGNSSIH